MTQYPPPPSDAWQSPYGSAPAAAPAPVPMSIAPPYSPTPDELPYSWVAPRPPQGDPGTLELPWYGIGPVDAVVRAYRKAFRYDGRASLGEYWWYMLFALLLGAALVSLYIIVMLGINQTDDVAAVSAQLVPVVGFAVLCHWIVGLSLTVRRLHDSGNSGLLCLLCLVPYVGGLIVIGLCCQRANPSGMRYDRPHVNAYYSAAQPVPPAHLYG